VNGKRRRGIKGEIWRKKNQRRELKENRGRKVKGEDKYRRDEKMNIGNKKIKPEKRDKK
jgi:hypothetical protein